jgi:hypothetical protein
MSRRLGTTAILVAAIAAAAGQFANTSRSAAKPPPCVHMIPGGACGVWLTANGPDPVSVQTSPLGSVRFKSVDSAAHTVVFANGLCSLEVDPSQQPFGAGCDNNFMAFPGRYTYTADGKFTGVVVTKLLPRSVSLTARTHTSRGGMRLTLHGRVTQGFVSSAPPPPVVVLARHSKSQPFERVATVRTRGDHQANFRWALGVHPDVPTTYIAEVTAQRLCYFPASRCALPHPQVWANPKSRPFAVRIRH